MGGMIGSTAVASADPSPTPTPTYKQVTLSPEESQRLCATKLPNMIERRDKLAKRISGSADVKGSVAWLKARSAKQKAKGHDKAAAQLEKRAERRAERLKQLATMKTKLETFKTEHCKAS
jgi:regulator of protease activity HflC (stomatin/prohibitin superfamily)